MIILVLVHTLYPVKTDMVYQNKVIQHGKEIQVIILYIFFFSIYSLWKRNKKKFKKLKVLFQLPTKKTLDSVIPIFLQILSLNLRQEGKKRCKSKKWKKRLINGRCYYRYLFDSKKKQTYIYVYKSNWSSWFHYLDQLSSIVSTKNSMNGGYIW